MDFKDLEELLELNEQLHNLTLRKKELESKVDVTALTKGEAVDSIAEIAFQIELGYKHLVKLSEYHDIPFTLDIAGYEPSEDTTWSSSDSWSTSGCQS